MACCSSISLSVVCLLWARDILRAVEHAEVPAERLGQASTSHCQLTAINATDQTRTHQASGQMGYERGREGHEHGTCRGRQWRFAAVRMLRSAEWAPRLIIMLAPTSEVRQEQQPVTGAYQLWVRTARHRTPNSRDPSRELRACGISSIAFSPVAHQPRTCHSVALLEEVGK